MFLSISLQAQVDTTVTIDRSKNIFRTNIASVKETTFGDRLTLYRIEHNYSYLQIQSLLSEIATQIHGYEILYKVGEVKRIERGEFMLFPEVQKAVEDFMNNP